MRSFAFGVALTLGAGAAMGSVSAAQSAGGGTSSARMQKVREAVSLAERGRQDEAMRIADQLLAEDARFEPALKLKGMLLEQAGRDEDAERMYEAALKLTPNDADLLLKTGIVHLQQGDKQGAIERLARLVHLRPSDGDAQFYLAQAYHLNGQDKQALEAIRASLRQDPGNATILQKYGELLCSTGDFASGLEQLKKAQEADATLPRMDYDLAWADYNLMDLANAAMYAKRAVEKHAGDVNALQLLAMAEIKQQHWAPAKDAYTSLLALVPARPELLQGLGQCELELKDYADAATHLEAALKLDPTLLLAHFYLSRTYAALGRTEDAQREATLHQQMMTRMTFVRTIQIEQGENAIAQQTRALLKAHRVEAALALYMEHFKGTGATTADAHVFVGKTYLYMGDMQDGMKELKQAVAMQPTVRGAHTLKGIVALKAGDLAKAESEFDAELKNDPNSQQAIAELGEVRYHQGRWADAAAQIERSNTMTPELLYMLCDAQYRLGRAKDANLTAELVSAYGRKNDTLMHDLVSLVERNGQADEARRLQGELAP